MEGGTCDSAFFFVRGGEGPSVRGGEGRGALGESFWTRSGMQDRGNANEGSWYFRRAEAMLVASSFSDAFKAAESGVEEMNAHISVPERLCLVAQLPQCFLARLAVDTDR